MLLRAPSPAATARNASERLLVLLLVGILVAGTAIRLHGLDRTSLWNDEAASWSMARQPFWPMFDATLADTHPPLFNLVLYATIRLLGDSEIALRLPSTLIGILNIYVIYRLGAALWDRLTGVLAAALLAFAGFHVWYSQEARMYALLCLAATAFALATVVFLRGPSRLRAALCGLSGVILLYSHVYGILNWGAINFAVGLALLAGAGWARAGWRTWLAIQCLVAISFLPWIFVLAYQAGHVIADFWIPFPTVRFLFWTARSVAGDFATLCCLLLLALIALLPPAADSVSRAWTTEPRRSRLNLLLESRWQQLLLLSWSLLPILGGYLVSLAGRPILFDRYLIGSLPPLLLLAARGLWVLAANRLILGGALAVVAAVSITPVYRSVAATLREDVRSTIPAFSERFEPTDGVVFSSAGLSNTFAYYYRGPVALQAMIRHPDSESVDWPGAARLWVFVRDGVAEKATPLLAKIETRYQRQQTFASYGITLYLYVRSPFSGSTEAPAGTIGTPPAR